MRRAGLCLLLVSGTAVALPPNSPYREGANHHVGDDSFVAARGRQPSARDSEASRMKTHLAWIRSELAAKPATRPELAARRAELLGYLDDYLAKGITPTNWALPWRTLSDGFSPDLQSAPFRGHTGRADTAGRRSCL